MEPVPVMLDWSLVPANTTAPPAPERMVSLPSENTVEVPVPRSIRLLPPPAAIVSAPVWATITSLALPETISAFDEPMKNRGELSPPRTVDVLPETTTPPVSPFSLAAKAAVDGL